MERMRYGKICALAAILLCLVLSGCDIDNSAENDMPNLDFIAYTGQDQYHWLAHKLYVDMETNEITMDSNVIFEIEDEHGWSDIIYPIAITDNLLVMRGEITGSADRPIKVCSREEYMGEYLIWNDEISLTYNPREESALLKDGDNILGMVDGLEYENMGLYPIAFFLDEGKLVILCERGDEEAKWDEKYPVSVIAAVADEQSKTYQIESMYTFENMFSSNLSKVKAPFRTWNATNAWANNETHSFYWNESTKIVNMNPYDGAFEIVLTENQVKERLPFLDANRESYEFFNGFCVQGDVYIAMFPNFNDISGIFAAMFRKNGEYMGTILCTENEIRLFNSDNEIVGSIEDDELKGLLAAY